MKVRLITLLELLLTVCAWPFYAFGVVIGFFGGAVKKGIDIGIGLIE